MAHKLTKNASPEHQSTRRGPQKVIWSLLLLICLIGSLDGWLVIRNASALAAASRELYHAAATTVRQIPIARRVNARLKNIASDTASGPSNRIAKIHIIPFFAGQSATNPSPPVAGVSSMFVYGLTTVVNIAADQTPKSAPVVPAGPPRLTALNNPTDCSQGIALNVVAHEDDDLLFMNPDIQGDISAGRCVRTVYMTAGDAGQKAGYWQGREQGSRAAYAAMYGVPNLWHDQQQLIHNKLVTVSFLNSQPGVALIFLRLPDGNLQGEGFSGTAHESLHKLVAGKLAAVHSLDTKTAYTEDDIVSILSAIMRTDRPGRIRAQNPEGLREGDHADHEAAALLTGLASDTYLQPHTLVNYAGYPDRLLKSNLSAEQTQAKQNVFMAYAQYDNAVCHTTFECAARFTYGNFLTRQYKTSESAGGL